MFDGVFSFLLLILILQSRQLNEPYHFSFVLSCLIPNFWSFAGCVFFFFACTLVFVGTHLPKSIRLLTGVKQHGESVKSSLLVRTSEGGLSAVFSLAN